MSKRSAFFLAFLIFGWGRAAFAQDRLPPIPTSQWTPAQRQSADAIVKGPRGGLVGPFPALLRSPDLMDRTQKMGEYLRYHSAIGTTLSELVILVAARQWTQQVEWAIHAPLALKAGIKPDTVSAVAAGQRPPSPTADEAIVYDFCMELHTTKTVSDATWAKAIKRFGEQGVVDMIAISGYYTYIAMLMNAARTPVPDGKPAPLKALPASR